MTLKVKESFSRELKRYPLVVVDAGVSGGSESHWLTFDKKELKLIGFEPFTREYNRLKESQGEDSNITYINSALYDRKAKLTLHLTKNERLSSVFMPNYDFLGHFPKTNRDRYELVDKIEVEVDTLDNLLSKETQKTLDFFKVDVEGAAFEVLSGAQETLRKGAVAGIQVEAEFVEKYKRQHLFPDVDLLLKRDGYELFDMRLCHWKRETGAKTGGTKGQPVHGDFLYLLNLTDFFKKIEASPQDERSVKIIKFIIICSIYSCYDFALELLSESFKRKWVDDRTHCLLQKELAKSSSILMRLPKLKGRGWLYDIIYHIYMSCYGIYRSKSKQGLGPE